MGMLSDAFEAVVSREEFETVQMLLKIDTRVAPQRREVYPFSGIAVCGDCGRLMARKVSTVAGRKYAYYMCSANKKDGGCSGHRIGEMELEEAVKESMNCHIEKLTELKGILDYIGILPMQVAGIKRLEGRIVQLEEEVQKYTGLKVSIYEDLKEGLISKEEYASMKQTFEDRRKSALTAAEKLRLEIGEMTQKSGRHHEWIEMFMKTGRVDKLIRKVVVELIDRVCVYEDKRIEIRFRYEDKYLEGLELVEELGVSVSEDLGREVS